MTVDYIPNTLQPTAAYLNKYCNWSQEQIVHVISEYKKFLQAFSEGLTSIVPPVAIDVMWHVHLIDQENYFAFCRDNYGKIVLHKLPADSFSHQNISESENSKMLLNLKYGIDFDDPKLTVLPSSHNVHPLSPVTDLGSAARCGNESPTPPDSPKVMRFWSEMGDG